ncbi:hypothetical protein PAEH1_08185 [Paenalcaligenes hominis]|uniref:Uncharacterized protein n=1 Tax=Paenalcaligenes hominis TaxID=643674 RepID=A0A1U9K0N1_9BURK|nr:hypothetical protein PAEH1_08185 [Paenalcaligenes hominis]
MSYTPKTLKVKKDSLFKYKKRLYKNLLLNARLFLIFLINNVVYFWQKPTAAAIKGILPYIFKFCSTLF